MKVTDAIVTLLLVVGGLNWGLVGFLNFDLVATILGDMTIFSRIIYAVVGLCAIYMVFSLKAMRRRWAESLTNR